MRTRWPNLGFTVVGCSIFAGAAFLDDGAFNTPKVGQPVDSSAGVNDVSAVITLAAQVVISFRCDFGGS